MSRPSSSGFRTRRLGPLRSQRGIVLVMVIWVLAFVGIVLSAFAFSMRTELDAARNFKEEAEASALAEAGIARALAGLANAGTAGGAAAGIVPPYDSGHIPFGRGTYRVVVTDEASRISLNGAPAELLRRLLQNTGVGDPRLLDTIVDAILDWQDPDNVPRANGAEEEYYRFLPHPYHPKNGAFDSLEELLLVRGMTRDILDGNIAAARRTDLLGRIPEERDLRPGEYLGIRPFLTVSGAGQVNRSSASLDVLLALGLSAREARAILDARQPAPPPGRLTGASQGPPPTGSSGRFRIESVGSPAGSRLSSRITAVVVKEGTQIRPRARVLSWREGS